MAGGEIAPSYQRQIVFTLTVPRCVVALGPSSSFGAVCKCDEDIEEVELDIASTFHHSLLRSNKPRC
jgi:hypothetical protein